MNKDNLLEPPRSSLPIPMLELALSPQRLTNSYKLYWFLGLLDIIKNFPAENSIIISFDDVIYKMISHCWYTILEYKLNFGTQDKLGRCVNAIYNETELKKNSSHEEIITTIKKIDNREVRNYINYLKRYVPYVFLSAFVTGLSRKGDTDRKNMIIENSRINPNVPYLITDDKMIIIDTAWLDYFYTNRTILESWAKFKLTKYLQNRNPNIPAIHLKLEAPCKRKLSAAREYWKEYLIDNHDLDIFSKEVLDPEEISIDHFIPWSFVLHDKIWNLVPTSRIINSSKNNKLPSWDEYFPLFSRIQFRSYIWSVQNRGKKKILEDYLILAPYGIKKDISVDAFRNILEEALQPSYRIALNQGFSLWDPNI